ncbi:MAG TPA: hypothetical protein VLT16_19005, partial [Candidatus Limnocylindrales bacterium]|nr:hypothetical protein [Candidatus Limnocylindrales bacterium]
TWHTNVDTYERIVPDDVKKDAILVAASIYQLAMRDEMLPRFTRAEMPPKPGPPGAAPAVPARAANAPEPGRPAAESHGAKPTAAPGEQAKPAPAQPAQGGTTRPTPRM